MIDNSETELKTDSFYNVNRKNCSFHLSIKTFSVRKYFEGKCVLLFDQILQFARITKITVEVENSCSLLKIST